ncbi:gliding motility-associated ABC transporter substrate-binding protein GldG [Namhaeicola litoreus]|uniref:Gliding motility-associated ABC transporter substrate-binding protein GldG n=1 Tax=Namhaeicola litoreus TaxID=1052145 RepID=A0ABW3Y4V3_9FLAO
MEQIRKKESIQMIWVIAVIAVILGISNSFYHRFDLTTDQRYTLSETTKDIVDEIEGPLFVKVYLEGDFPAEFKRIQTETRQHLEELRSLNKDIVFQFINPLTKTNELIESGLQPSKLSVQENGQVSQAIIFPYAVLEYKGKKQNVSLLSEAPATSQEEQLQNSIQNLEFAFTDGINKLVQEKQKSVAVLRGNGELSDLYLYSALKKLGEYVHLAEFTLDSSETNPQNTLKELQKYDLALIAKPTKLFTENQKFTLDQFILNGGKTVWFIDQTTAELDSLMDTGNSLVMNRDLGLTDLLFAYGVRVNYNLTKDMYASTIRLAAGNSGNQTQYEDFPWLYFPLIFSKNNHPINTNLDPVFLRFPSTIDTLKNSIEKTILLHSSPYAKIIGTPADVSLNEIAENPTQESFNQKNLIYGVLLEGEFQSAYKNRIKPFSIQSATDESVYNQMVVVSDGDLIANDVLRGEPLPLDQDKWTKKPLGNQQFLLNTVLFLLEDQSILELRAKQVQIKFLDKEKAYREKGFWQILNVLLPLILLMLFGIIFNYIRKKRYTS